MVNHHLQLVVVLWIVGKKRHGIRELTNVGEKLSVDNEAAPNYIKVFKGLASSLNYSPQQVHNDRTETGLNFEGLSTKSLDSQEENSTPGFNMDK